jgi:polyisoprenoid-binding protein YceI
VRWVLAGVVAVAVVVVGVPFVYIHFIEGSPPAPLHLAAETPTSTTTVADGTSSSSSSTPTGASGTGAVSVDGVWNVTSGSQAGYRIQETLFGQSNTAVGRTSAVTGSMTISGTTVERGSFSVDLTKVTSDQSQRDHQFQGRIMDTASFPTATFTLTRPVRLGSLPSDGVEITETVTGNLTMHGVTRPVTFQVTARRSGSTIQAVGSIPITFADWNISNPSGGPATTEDHGILEFLINFTHS